jgi:hypothetical protein
MRRDRAVTQTPRATLEALSVDSPAREPALRFQVGLVGPKRLVSTKLASSMHGRAVHWDEGPAAGGLLSRRRPRASFCICNPFLFQ